MGGWTGQGNIDIDPMFRNPEIDNYHLMSKDCGDLHYSPCIDVGHPQIHDGLLDCDWGLSFYLSDMGAYGGLDSLLVGINEPDHLLPVRLILHDNYPNPFNLTTLISYELPEPSNVILDIYNILGQKIIRLTDGRQDAGSHSIFWDATACGSGIYLVRIQAENYCTSKKMTLIK